MTVALEGLEESPARHGLLRYAAAKAGGALLSIAMVIVATFFLFRLLPGDPVRALAQGRNMTPEQLDLERARLGLDKPIPEQFLHFLQQTLSFDLGTSYEYKRPVVDLIGERIGSTLLLTGTALVMAVSLGLWQGARAGWKPGSRFDKVSTAVSLVLWSVPTFWLGLLLLMVFAAGIGPIPGIFPTRGSSSVDKPDGFAGVLDVAQHMVLPCLTLVAVVYAQYLLVMRSSVIDEVGQDYITTARAKGLTDQRILDKHAFPNALLPMVTLIAINLGYVVAGAITAEIVFSWPGLGTLTVQALDARDYPLLQAIFLLIAVSVVFANFAADIAYGYLDPRVRA